jgi:hypothetical protein
VNSLTAELQICLSRCRITSFEIEEKKLNKKLMNISLKDKLSLRFNLKGISASVLEMIRFPSKRGFN